MDTDTLEQDYNDRIERFNEQKLTRLSTVNPVCEHKENGSLCLSDAFGFSVKRGIWECDEHRREAQQN